MFTSQPDKKIQKNVDKVLTNGIQRQPFNIPTIFIIGNSSSLPELVYIINKLNTQMQVVDSTVHALSLVAKTYYTVIQVSSSIHRYLRAPHPTVVFVGCSDFKEHIPKSDSRRLTSGIYRRVAAEPP